MSTSSLPSISSVFTTAGTLIRSSASDSKTLWSCKLCQRSFLSQLELVQHEDQAHRQDKYQTFHCPVCKAMFSNQAFLTDHLLKSHGLRPECFSSCHHCPSCKIEYNTLELLIQHIRHGCTHKQITQPGQENTKPENNAIVNQASVSANVEKNVPDTLNTAIYGVKSSILQSRASEGQIPVIKEIENIVVTSPDSAERTVQLQVAENIVATPLVKPKPYQHERKNSKQTTVPDKCLQKTWRLPKKRKNSENIIHRSKCSSVSRVRPAQNVTNIRQSARSGNVWDQAQRLSGNCLQLTWKLPKKSKHRGIVEKKSLTHRKYDPGPNYLQPPAMCTKQKVTSAQQIFVQSNPNMTGSNSEPQVAAYSNSVYKDVGMISTQEALVRHIQASAQVAQSQGNTQDTPVVHCSDVGQILVSNLSPRQGNADSDTASVMHVQSNWMPPVTSVDCKNSTTVVSMPADYHQTRASGLEKMPNGHIVIPPLLDAKKLNIAGTNSISASSCIAVNGISSTAVPEKAGIVKDGSLQTFPTGTSIQDESAQTLDGIANSSSQVISGLSAEISNNNSSVVFMACAFCDSAFDSIKALYEHEQTHEKMGTLMCKECGVCATKLVDIYQHVGPNRKCPEEVDSGDNPSPEGPGTVSNINTTDTVATGETQVMPPVLDGAMSLLGQTVQNIPESQDQGDNSGTPTSAHHATGLQVGQAMNIVVACSEKVEGMEDIGPANKSAIESVDQTKDSGLVNGDMEVDSKPELTEEINNSQSPGAVEESEDGSLHLQLECSDTEGEN